MTKTYPTQTELEALFNYDPEKGYLLTQKNTRAGSLHKASGNRVIYVKGKYYPEQNLVWCLLKGVYPSGAIGHKNQIRTDNRPDNLYMLNATQPRAIPRNNRSGVRGISWFSRTQKWRVTIHTQSKPLHIGYYSNLHDAVHAQQQAYIKYHAKPLTHTIAEQDQILADWGTQSPTPNKTTMETEQAITMPAGWTAT